MFNQYENYFLHTLKVSVRLILAVYSSSNSTTCTCPASQAI